MENKNKCTETARITLPWGGKLLNYCPVHANQIVILGNAMGNAIQAQLLPPNTAMECESNNILAEDEKEFNRTFPLTPTIKS